MSVEIFSPRSRDEWLAIRRTTIGASEVASLLGANPYMSAYELFMHKTGAIPPVEETGAMRRGRHLESVAIEMLREEFPDWSVEANPMPRGRFYRDIAIGASCTPDAFVEAPGRPNGRCQIKSVHKAAFAKAWKTESGEVEPPTYVAVQAIQEAALTGADWCCVAALVIDWSIELHVIDVPIHRGLIERIEREIVGFWDRVNRNDPYAPDYGSDGAIIAGLYPDDNGSTVDLTDDNELPEIAAEDLRLDRKSVV